MLPRPLVLAAIAMATSVNLTAAAADPPVQLVTLDPGHFHASLVQKFMYPQVSPLVRVYGPAGPEMEDHLQRVQSFNTRADKPTHWEEKIYRGQDFLDKMIAEKAGNVVVISGNNARKTEYIERSIAAGFNVLADKPMAINPEDFERLRQTFTLARANQVLLYDIMTERSEITTILQRELARDRAVFGTLEKGTPADPAVEMISVHHYFKEVAGKTLTRPAWFFDVRQQGEAIPDVGTHLVDLVQWECFPDKVIDWKKDIQVTGARRWPTALTFDQFKRLTGLDAYPDYLKRDVDAENRVNVYENGEVNYALRGVHVKASVIWNFAPPPGAKDTHYSMLRGTRATLRIKQGAEQKWAPVLYVENRSKAAPAEFEKHLRAGVMKLAKTWPGIDVKAAGEVWELVIPEHYSIGHEAHFAQVTERYLKYLAEGKLPSWEVPNMIAKYYTTTQAYALGHRK